MWKRPSTRTRWYPARPRRSCWRYRDIRASISADAWISQRSRTSAGWLKDWAFQSSSREAGERSEALRRLACWRGEAKAGHQTAFRAQSRLTSGDFRSRLPPRARACRGRAVGSMAVPGRTPEARIRPRHYRSGSIVVVVAEHGPRRRWKFAHHDHDRLCTGLDGAVVDEVFDD